MRTPEPECFECHKPCKNGERVWWDEYEHDPFHVACFVRRLERVNALLTQFIVNKGWWTEYVDQLPRLPTPTQEPGNNER